MESTFSDRLSALIEALDIKKVRFAERLKVDQSYVTQLTNGRRNPSDRLISDICREFNVNETWLRTGEGEMFVQRARDEEIADFVGEVFMEESGSFKQRFIAMLAGLDEKDWEFLEKKAIELVEGKHGKGNIG